MIYYYGMLEKSERVYEKRESEEDRDQAERAGDAWPHERTVGKTAVLF